MTDHLKSVAQRIENLMDERDGIQSDIRDIYAEAKSHGYIPKVLRKAITRKRMDAGKRDEEDAILELYEDALGPVGKAVAAVRAGSTWKDASEEHNVPRATLARAVKVSKQQTDTTPTAEHPKPRSPAILASDCTQPVEVARKDTLAGERGTDSATGNSAHEGEDDGRSNDGNAAVPEPQESMGAGDCDVFDGAECAEPNQRAGRASGSQDDIRGQGLRANDGIAGCSVEALSATGRLPGDVRGRLPVDQPAGGVSGGVHEAVDLAPPPSLAAKRKEIEAGRAHG